MSSKDKPKEYIPEESKYPAQKGNDGTIYSGDFTTSSGETHLAKGNQKGSNKN